MGVGEGGRNLEPKRCSGDCDRAMTRSLENIEDEMLVLRAPAGDAGAFEALLRRWLPVIRRHASRLTGEGGMGGAAEDVAQEACLALAAGLRSLHDPARAYGWMLRIVTNKAADWVRRRGRERELRRGLESREPRGGARAGGEGGDAGDLLEQAASRERAEMIRAACGQLPMDLRALVSLYYGEGLPVGAVAEVMGVPGSTVKSRLHEAREQLRAILERSTS